MAFVPNPNFNFHQTFGGNVTVFGCLYVYGNCGITFQSGANIKDDGSGGINITATTVNISGNTTTNNIVVVNNTTTNNLSVGSTVSIGGTVYDGNGNNITIPPSSAATLGAFLRSDGTKPFWDNTPFGALLPISPYGGATAGIGETTALIYTGATVRGYTYSGYQNSVAYLNIYKTQHATDTTTDLGAIMQYYDAYTDGGSSGRYAYDFHAYTTTGHADSGNNINKHDMVTDANINFSTTMTTSKTVTQCMRNRYTNVYVFGNTDPEKFTYATETPVVASTTWANRNNGGTSLATARGDTYGYYQGNTVGNKHYLEFATETWNTWSPGITAGAGAWISMSTYTGYIYWKGSATSFFKFNSADTTSVLVSTVTTPSQQEENYHTGESKGYMVGMYNGVWNATGGILNYISDTFSNVTSVDAPAINSSAACIEYGRYGV